jgi:hypothetical protein
MHRRDALETLAAIALCRGVTPMPSEEMKRVAHVLLPAGTFAETSGTYREPGGPLAESAVLPRRWVNRGRRGRFCACWAISSDISGFDYQSSEQVRDELKSLRWRAEPATDVPRTGELQPVASEPIAWSCRCIRSIRSCVAPARLLRTRDMGREARSAMEAMREDAERLGQLDARCRPTCIRRRVHRRADRHSDPERRLYDAVGAQGHRLDAAAHRSEPREDCSVCCRAWGSRSPTLSSC